MNLGSLPLSLNPTTDTVLVRNALVHFAIVTLHQGATALVRGVRWALTNRVLLVRLERTPTG